MVKDFIESYTKLLVTHPESIRVSTVDSTDECEELIIYANQDDVGKIIGKDGKMINAIKTVVAGCKAKGAKNYRISVHANNNV